ncbi:TetR/AcrR family transcriptional regulator [Neogemmobacter tilapiae]|uniref:TetR family transcriptional regulator n=1 Tax=Neogemmobacter tilapiae TaxID=875041 RepID=A0A918WM26_9RHOB|nr:TetR/AcrR family transcriptional regulator [Gemmobacter tilapiae]GHC59326.1 TetR family transcriptional regulator [Gemmobacter tilapiae]
MKKTPEAESGWRGSREGWLAAAYDALIEGGVEAVKILPVAAKLNLSRTSFYWFFKDRAALLDGLRERWTAQTTVPLVAATRADAATETEAMLNVIGCFLSDATFDSRLEFAFRSWALQDVAMMRLLHRADEERLAALSAMLRQWGHSAQDADVRARTVYLVQIGYIAMQTRETLETRLARIPHYVEIYTGQLPSDVEMARFQARLGGAS